MRILLFIAVVGLVAGCRGGDSEKPPVHLIQNMMNQEKGRPYRAEKNGIFADGRMMRTPVEGTVAVGQLDEDDLKYEGMDADGGVAHCFPSEFLVEKEEKVTDAVRARGENRYNIYCTPCHGINGDGKGPVALRGLEIPPANFHDQLKKDLLAGKIYQAIRGGVNNGNMPSYAAQIPVNDRWAYRQLRPQAPGSGRLRRRGSDRHRQGPEGGFRCFRRSRLQSQNLRHLPHAGRQQARRPDVEGAVRQAGADQRR